MPQNNGKLENTGKRPFFSQNTGKTELWVIKQRQKHWNCAFFKIKITYFYLKIKTTYFYQRNFFSIFLKYNLSIIITCLLCKLNTGKRMILYSILRKNTGKKPFSTLEKRGESTGKHWKTLEIDPRLLVATL